MTFSEYINSQVAECDRIQSCDPPAWVLALLHSAARYHGRLALYGESTIRLPRRAAPMPEPIVYRVSNYTRQLRETERHFIHLFTPKPWRYRLEPTNRFNPATTSGLSVEYQNYLLWKTYLWPPTPTTPAPGSIEWVISHA